MASFLKITFERDKMITPTLLRKRSLLLVHAGRSDRSRVIRLTRNMIGHHIGEYVFTKKLGAAIHDSARNRKRKNKNKQK